MNDINAVIQDSNNNETFGEIVSDGFFATAVSNEMKKSDESMTNEIVNNVFYNAASILNNCPNPNKKGDFKKTGIVIGKVQSGKTSNFIALLALAFDNGYKLAVVIGGNTTELLSQNVNRIRKSFNVGNDKLVILHSKDNNDLLSPNIIRNFISNGKKVLIVTLKSPQEKNEKHMTRVSKLFDDSVLANETTIIIDDEGDQATLNSKVYSKKLNDNIAKTYKVALDIKNKIHRHCFISITATPQANILIETSNLLSPDFGKLIYPGLGYCGLSVFHGDEQDKYVKVIPDNEESLLDVSGGIPVSFLKAIAAFYVGNAIRKARGDNGIHSMLIHPSVKKFDHKLVKDKVDSLLINWQNIAKLGKEDISYKCSLRRILFGAYSMYKDEGAVTREFEDIESTILQCILTSSNAIVFNSDQINARADAEFYETRIYLGGNILDRGITIKGLAITYIFRRAKGYSNVDNTEQRARWFGYKNVPFYSDYIDVCRVWATDAIKKDFASINECDEEMWSSIERNMKYGKSFKELPRYFMLQNEMSHKLKLTRPNVARTYELSWTEWKPQKYFVKDKESCDANMKLLLKYRNNHGGVIKHYGGVNVHLYQYNIDLKDFLDNVLGKFIYDVKEDFDINLFYKIYYLIVEKGLNSKVDLCWVRYQNNETRKILDDGSIQNLFRGQDLKPNSAGVFAYLGDRHTCDDRPNNIQFQIHFVKASNLPGVDYYSPAISIYIPEDYAFKLVGRSNE